MYINNAIQLNCRINILNEEAQFWEWHHLSHHLSQWFLDAAILAANLSSSSGLLTWVFMCAERLFILWNILQEKSRKYDSMTLLFYLGSSSAFKAPGSIWVIKQ